MTTPPILSRPRRAVPRGRAGQRAGAIRRAVTSLLVPAAVLAAAAGLAACGGSGPGRAASAGAVRFRPIVEPFDPHHAAEVQSSPANCRTETTTVGIEQCEDDQAESLDARIDLVQRRRFGADHAAGRRAINADDAAWLTARPKVCAAAYRSGGTIDLIDIAACLRDESATRLAALIDAEPSVTHLSGTDALDLELLDYFTTRDGTRLSPIDTQGDQTGGAVISWVVIGGYRGFTVEPAQFPFIDGPFRRAGVIEGPDPTGHVVAAGQIYQFSLDYPSLDSDPDAAHPTGGFTYSPGGRTLAVFS